MHVRNVGGEGGQRSALPTPRMLLASDSHHLLFYLLVSSHNEYRLFANILGYIIHPIKKEMKGGTLEGKEHQLLGVLGCSGL